MKKIRCSELRNLEISNLFTQHEKYGVLPSRHRKFFSKSPGRIGRGDLWATDGSFNDFGDTGNLRVLDERRC